MNSTMSPFNSTSPCFGLTIEQCQDLTGNHSSWLYRPSLVLNGLLIGIFGASLVANIIQGTLGRTWGFAIAMVLGCTTEVIGYVGRIMAYNDMDGQNPFLIQICCLTFAPAFLAAGIYLCLSRIVVVFGSDISRIPPKWYTYIFVVCDFFSLLLQSAGGGMAAIASNNNKSPQPGTNVMLVGLSFQVVTLVLFMLLCAEYGWRVVQRLRSGVQLDPTHAKLRQSKRFKAFLCALAISTTCILIRSIFRVVEMAQGWEGQLAADETLFFILEGVMVAIAVVILNIFHPGYCFADAYNIPRGKLSPTSGSEIELGHDSSYVKNESMMNSR